MPEIIPRPNRIELKNSPGTRHEEAHAGGANIFPGNLLEITDDDGDSKQVVNHSDEGGPTEVFIAKEDALQGRTIHDVYNHEVEESGVELLGDPVFYLVSMPGDEVFIRLANGENASKNDPLASNGDGTFKVAGAEDWVIAHANEDLNLTEATEPEHVRARVAHQHQLPAGT